jgi:fumarate reductase subunit C
MIVTDEEAEPGSSVNPIAYLGFVEFAQGGVIVAGDRVSVNGEDIGYVCGFDETHMPNHLNIVVRGQRLSGRQRGFKLAEHVLFTKPGG